MKVMPKKVKKRTKRRKLTYRTPSRFIIQKCREAWKKKKPDCYLCGAY